MPRGSGSSRRPRAEAGTRRETARSRSTAARDTVVLQETVVIEPRTQAGQRDSPVNEEPRFQIFIVDAGWNSPARRVLHENFGMLRDLAKNDPIYVLSRENSIDFIQNHPSLLGKGPAIVVHDLAALREAGATGFHGFRLHLGLMRSEEQALLALELFARFLATHRRSVDLEADVRRNLRREGIIGAIEIILHHEPRELGG
jgi:hypothetical protein